MMNFDAWVECKNISMENFWFWYNTPGVPQKECLAEIFECEWEIQEW